MNRIAATLALAACAALVTARAADRPVQAWVQQSNAYTRQLQDIEFRYSPEEGSQEGYARFDTLIGKPTLAADQAERRELQAVLDRLRQQQSRETDPQVREDLEIIRKAFDLRFREEDFEETRLVPFYNADLMVYSGLSTLLSDRVAAKRRPAAVTRLKKYAGAWAGTAAYTQLLQQRTLQRMAAGEPIYPSRVQVETELGRNANYIEGIAALFRKYHLKGWEKPYARLRQELSQYDAWVRSTLLPKARDDSRLPPEQYALALERYGIDLPPEQLSRRAHEAFTQIQSQMTTLAAQLARDRGLPNSDYRAVVAQLKQQQVTGEAILPLYRERLKQIEQIISTQALVTLPSRAAVIRLATAAESARQPAPYMSPPPFTNNHGERGEFVLPLNLPSTTATAADRYDDFTNDAATWTMTAHEARPGHELQFAAMVENGVSLARALYAFNSTNAEGWGLYAEYLMQPFEPADGQLITLQFRLLRAARAFLDPELQSGTTTPEQAYQVLEKDVGLSHAFATEEVERFTYRMPGQAGSYFYGYTRLLALRQEAEAALGARFSQQKFHDFILQLGLLPPDLQRKAVLEEFLPAQR